MRIGIVTGPDDVGKVARELLLQLYAFKRQGKFSGHPIYQFGMYDLYTLDTPLISAEKILSPADILFFLTTHRSEENRRTITVHPIGNWGAAELGGQVRTLVMSPAGYFKHILQTLVRNCPSSYEASLEATHHGPLLAKPALFVEVGSTPKEWMDREAVRVVGEAVMEARELPGKTAVLFGGGHYNSEANKIMLRSEVAIGHICPKYHLDALSEDVVMQSFSKVLPKAALAIIDWKGATAVQRTHLLEMFHRHQVPWKKSKDCRS